jgi:hypothetical protein
MIKFLLDYKPINEYSSLILYNIVKGFLMKRIGYIALGLLFLMTPAIYSMSCAVKRKSLPFQEAPIKETALKVVNEMIPVDVSGWYRKKTDLLLDDEKLATVIYHVAGIDNTDELKLQKTGISPFQATIEGISIYDTLNADKYSAYRVLLAYALADIINSHEEQKKSVPIIDKHEFTIEAIVWPNMEQFFQTLGFSKTKSVGVTAYLFSQRLTPASVKSLKNFCSPHLSLLTSGQLQVQPELQRSERLKALKEATEKKSESKILI